MMSASEFNEPFREQLRRLLLWRRDVRRFRTAPVPEELLRELLDLTRLAPSVGLSQPWRFIRVNSAEARKEIRSSFARANAEALAGYSGEQASLYARLKLAGLDHAPEQLAVFADTGTQTGSGLGRRTMPEMLEYSAVCAITTLWFSARAYGVGLGWVSILDPQRVCQVLSVPTDWRLIAYLCLGYPEEESTTPELELSGWEQRNRESSPWIER